MPPWRCTTCVLCSASVVAKRSHLIVISGSREWTDYPFILTRLQMLEHPARVFVGYDPEKRLPKGVDQMVYKACNAIGIEVECFPAEWSRYGSRAGVLRNEKMLEHPEVEHFVAFWVGNSPGTRDAVRRAYQHEVPWIEIHRRPA